MTLEQLKYETYTDDSMREAFFRLCNECVSKDDFVKEWNRLTGYCLGASASRPPIVKAIDGTCGYNPDKEAIPDFVDFVFEYIWAPVVLKAEEEFKEANNE